MSSITDAIPPYGGGTGPTIRILLLGAVFTSRRLCAWNFNAQQSEYNGGLSHGANGLLYLLFGHVGLNESCISPGRTLDSDVVLNAHVGNYKGFLPSSDPRDFRHFFDEDVHLV